MPGAAPIVGVPTPATPDGAPLAGWWMRVLAQFIDGLVLDVVTWIALLPTTVPLMRDFADMQREIDRQLRQSPDVAPDLRGSLTHLGATFESHAIWLLLAIVMGIAYSAIMLRIWGATLGKLALGLRVRLRDRPGPLPWSAIGRRLAVQQIGNLVTVALFLGAAFWVVMLLAAPLSLVLLLDPLWAAWDDKRQAIHDKVARTNVVKVR